jgi:hypothetical protein
MNRKKAAIAKRPVQSGVKAEQAGIKRNSAENFV